MLHSTHVFKSKINLFQVSSAMTNICKGTGTIFPSSPSLHCYYVLQVILDILINNSNLPCIKVCHLLFNMSSSPIHRMSNLHLSSFFLLVIATMRDLRKKDKLEAAAGDTLNQTLTIQRLDVCSDESVAECMNSLPEKQLDVLGR